METGSRAEHGLRPPPERRAAAGAGGRHTSEGGDVRLPEEIAATSRGVPRPRAPAPHWSEGAHPLRPEPSQSPIPFRPPTRPFSSRSPMAAPARRRAAFATYPTRAGIRSRLGWEVRKASTGSHPILSKPAGKPRIDLRRSGADRGRPLQAYKAGATRGRRGRSPLLPDIAGPPDPTKRLPGLWREAGRLWQGMPAVPEHPCPEDPPRPTHLETKRAARRSDVIPAEAGNSGDHRDYCPEVPAAQG